MDESYLKIIAYCMFRKRQIHVTLTISVLWYYYGMTYRFVSSWYSYRNKPEEILVWKNQAKTRICETLKKEK